MTINLSSKSGAGAFKAPATLTINQAVGAIGMRAVDTTMGLSTTTAVTSSSLTTVINISNGGYLSFLALVANTATTVANSKMRVTIDSVVVLDATATVTDSSNQQVIGSYNNNSDSISESIVIFNTSLLVEIAGDSTNACRAVYKLVET